MPSFAAEDRAARESRRKAVQARIRGNGDRIAALNEQQARKKEDWERGRLEKKTRERLQHLERLGNA